MFTSISSKTTKAQLWLSSGCVRVLKCVPRVCLHVTPTPPWMWKSLIKEEKTELERELLVLRLSALCPEFLPTQ